MIPQKLPACMYLTLIEADRLDRNTKGKYVCFNFTKNILISHQLRTICQQKPNMNLRSTTI